MLFEYKDCLSPIKDKGKIVLKQGVQKDALYTFCIPTFKRSGDLREALDSVYAQQTAIPFNVVLSDNNPERDDETEKLIEEYYQDKENLTYFKNAENLGMAGNWNRLILECRTEYMILFHDDDVLFPNFLERIDTIRKIYPGVTALNAGKQKSSNPSGDTIKSKSGRIVSHTAKSNYCKYLFGAPSGCLFRMADLDAIGGFDEVSYPSIDYVAIEKLCLSNKPVISTTEPLMFYRVGSNATAKLDTQLKWLDIDYQIKTELKEKLGVSSALYKTALWFETKMRLRGVNKISPGTCYNGYKAGGNVFCVLYNMYDYCLRTRG